MGCEEIMSFNFTSNHNNKWILSPDMVCNLKPDCHLLLSSDTK